MCNPRTDLPSKSSPMLECDLLPALSRICNEDALIVTDASGGVAYCNDGATRIFGYSADEMMGSAFSRTVPVEFQAEEGELLRGLNSGAARRYEAARLCKDGRRLNVLASVSAIANDAGSAASLLRCERAVSSPAEEDQAISKNGAPLIAVSPHLPARDEKMRHGAQFESSASFT